MIFDVKVFFITLFADVIPIFFQCTIYDFQKVLIISTDFQFGYNKIVLRQPKTLDSSFKKVLLTPRNQDIASIFGVTNTLG